MAAPASKVIGASALLVKYGPWIHKYRGGIPAGVMAAYMQHESNGNFNAAGDVQLGEIGYYQIAAYVPPLFGYPADARKDPETNIALASLEYALEAIKWHLRMPNLVQLGTIDSWKLARLSFAVGRGGSYKLADLARSYLQPGRVYEGITKYVAANGAPQLSAGQDGAKVAKRVAGVNEQWEIGQAVDGSGLGGPQLIPAPPAGPYKLPKDAAPYFKSPFPGIVLAALAGGAGLLYYVWRTR